MNVKQKRWLFSKFFAQLVLKAIDLGFHPAIDQIKRTTLEASSNAKTGSGIVNSLHTLGLAGDLLLYKNGQYLKSSEDYRELGEWWENLHELCRWGGRFKRADGNHFSIEHNGIR